VETIQQKQKGQIYSSILASSTGLGSKSYLETGDFKHPWFNETYPFNNFRTNPVFMIPAHLNLAEVSKIMLGSNVTFKVRFNNIITNGNDIIANYYELLQTKRKTCELHNCVLDLQYETN
jgi:hypothetical protein